jgi:hypothetical protein
MLPTARLARQINLSIGGQHAPNREMAARKLWKSLVGIEAVIAAGLYLIWPIFVSFYLNLLFRKHSSLAIEIYVIVWVGVTIASWFNPTTVGAVLCSYFSLSSVVALLDVVFLSRVLGGVESTERSLILFLFNLVQVIFMFSVWYQLKAHLDKDEALFSAVLVLGTLGYPGGARTVVELQVVTDLLLFAIFLAHLVGRVGMPDQKN